MKGTSAIFCGATFALLFGCTTVEPGHAPAAFEAWRATNATVHERRAESALARAEWSEAVQSAREALRVTPERFETTMLLARALLCSRRFEETEPIARRAIDLRSDDANAHLVLGECLTALGRLDEAEDCYRRAADLGSDDAALVIGANALAAGDEIGAKSLLDVSSATPAELGVLASHDWQRGDVARAAELVDRAALRNPDDPNLKLRREALRLERDGAAAAPPAGESTPEMIMLRAAALLERGAAEEAAAEYRRAAELLPVDPTVRVALGEALLVAGDKDGALAAFRAAERLDPACLDAIVGVGRAELSAGRAREAVIALDRAVAKRPDHLPTRSLLVAATVVAGDFVRASAEAEEVRMRSPGSRLDRACRELLARTSPAAAESPDRHP